MGAAWVARRGARPEDPPLAFVLPVVVVVSLADVW